MKIFIGSDSYLPDLVMIISVPRSLNLSQRSLVSKWHTTFFNSSLLHLSCRSGFFGVLEVVVVEEPDEVVGAVCGEDASSRDEEVATGSRVSSSSGAGGDALVDPLGLVAVLSTNRSTKKK